jgi:hypothetical protein
LLFSYLLDVSEYLDDYDAAPTDILLAIVTELADTLRTKLGIELKDNYFVKRFSEIREFLLSDVEINEGELQLGFAKAKVQRLKKDPTARQKVRAVLEPKMSTMLEETNTIFDEARLAVKKTKIADSRHLCKTPVPMSANCPFLWSPHRRQYNKRFARTLRRFPKATGKNWPVLTFLPIKRYLTAIMII